MKRWHFLLVPLIAAAAAAVALFGCKGTVKVSTGTRYVCTYGEALGSDVHEIEVPSAEAGKYHVATKTITCAKHLTAEKLYADAQAAIGRGDLKAAQTALAAVVKVDPKFRKASTQLSQIVAHQKPTPDTAPDPTAQTPGTQNGSGDSTPTSGTPRPKPGSPAMDAYRYLVPDSLAGFRAEAITAEDLSLTRDYVPSDTSRYDQLVVFVQQCASSDAARRAIATQIRPAYPSSGADVTAAGLRGYFGTNGSGFAAMSLVKDNLLVTLELHATGAKASALKSDLSTLAGKVLK